MADPLRRTILAKLRGKRSKKGTALSGRGVSPNGDGEGKGNALPNRADPAQRAPMSVTQLGVVPDTMWGNASSFNGGVEHREDSVSAAGESLPCELAFMGFTGGSVGGSEEPLSWGARVNEEPPGVSLQRRAPPSGGGGGLDASAPRGHELRSVAGSSGRPCDRRKHAAVVPRKLFLGDSIGFGTCETRGSRGAAALRTGARCTPVLKGESCPEEPRNPAATAGDRTDPVPLGFVEPRGVRAAVAVRGPGHEQQPLLRRPAPQPCCSPGRRRAEENVLIRTVESYDASPDRSGPRKVNGFAKVTSLQSPMVFPTHLEYLVEANVGERASSEEDDYYDNEILPFYEPGSSNPDSNDDGTRSQRSAQGNCGSAVETDRLRTQLKEAYHLLINAMQDISFDGQVGVNGFFDHDSTSSRSRDSVCSRSSARAVDSDAWSSGKNSPGRLSDTDSLLLSCTGAQGPRLGNRLFSKSSENLGAARVKALLPRPLSDGAIRYPVCQIRGKSLDSRRATACGDRELRGATATDGPETRATWGGISGDELHQENGLLNESGGSVNSLTGSSDYAETQGNKHDLNGSPGVSAKPHGVTVNKMQEWMHKGRVLSSEMKRRIAGSSPRVHGSLGPRSARGLADRTKSTGQTTGTQESKSAAPCQGAQQSALIENVHSRSAASAEVRSGRANDSRPSLNTITVSKKRNWLQQSSGKGHAAEDGPSAVGSDGGHGQVAVPAALPSECFQVNSTVPQAAPPKPPRLHVSVSRTAGHARSSPAPKAVDSAEENDADDEGEIWYNPIPEDEEPEVLQAPRRRASAGDSAGAAGASPAGPEGADVCRAGPGGEASQAIAAHSTEPTQLRRQMFACKSAAENPAARNTAPDDIELSSSGFSPPSSPNPAKKGSSINWSFPDKIKSPRTVRKLSMKMKKLPELSRKLSVKGTCNSTQPELRTLSAKSGVETVQGPPQHSPRGGQTAASRNVISRYHLDSSVSTQHSYSKKKNGGGSKSASKGGYLSDGDSPELVAKSGKHGPEGKTGKSKEPPANSSPKLHGTELDIDAFRHYCFVDQPKFGQYISGLMNLHFYGAEDLKPPRIDSRDVYCAIQVDCVNKARTALLTCRTTFLDMDHTFNIELENAQHLKLVVFSWEPTPRKNRVCCHGTVVLPTLFRVAKTHQLAVKLEPRGVIYVKLNLMEQWQNSLDGPDVDQEPQVFGVEAWKVVERENVGLMVPLIIEKCITEIEKRGCQVVGLYRLCGSAAVKKELREAFERDSRLVELSENQYPDINVITGVLKDYLRELPYPLISKQLYEAVLDFMAKRPLRIGTNGNENDPADSEHTVSLLEILPDVEKATLRKLLDHLKRVASHHEVNKMTCQNLAVCFGPVLLSQRQEASCHSNRVFIDSEELASALHFKKHIEVLHYLLQLWPVVNPQSPTSAPMKEPSMETTPAPQYLRRRRERPQVLNLSEAEMAGVLRPKPGRLDSPSNRYAGDWSRCGDNYLQPPKRPPSEEADYDDVPSEDMEDTEDQQGKLDQVFQAVEENEVEEGLETCQGDLQKDVSPSHIISTQEPLAKEHTYQAYMKIQEISPVLSNRVNLKDLQESIDTLIGNLERELNKNKLNVGY
ncbi:rho GTPase-activating protein SYDE2-like [Scleropages formosus]|uniref:Synapse defective Rho GTPase homolog 2 n=1 Tax=Scleropages formosus TaxID=113540 RepID=A0A8D0CH40_SCLFO|nr:rho GTPase-activating protein SYDE2-like [Scleropages formosus]